MITITRRELISKVVIGTAGLSLGVSSLAKPYHSRTNQNNHTFKIGACDWSIGKKQNPEAFYLGKHLGLNGIQFSFNGGDYDLRNKSVRQQIVETVDETGVAISSLAMGILNRVPYYSDPDAERSVNECIDVMSIMGQEANAQASKSLAAKVSPKIVLLAFFNKGDINGDIEKMNAVIKRLKTVAPKAEQAGVTIGLETWLNVDDHLRILNEVGSPSVKVYYDVANSNKMGYDIYREIEILGSENICEIHCKENGSLLGAGRIDFPRVKKVIENMDYKGWLIIESATDKMLGVEKSYQHNQQYLRNLFNT